MIVILKPSGCRPRNSGQRKSPPSTGMIRPITLRDAPWSYQLAGFSGLRFSGKQLMTRTAFAGLVSRTEWLSVQQTNKEQLQPRFFKRGSSFALQDTTLYCANLKRPYSLSAHEICQALF